MQPIVDLAPGAEESPLAAPLAELLRKNLAASPRKTKSFNALRCAVLFVAEDLGESVTLRFDHGKVTLHEGNVGVPTVTLAGSAESLLDLRNVPLSKTLSFPRLFASGRPSLTALASRLARGDLRVYGLVAHPRLFTRLLRVLSED